MASTVFANNREISCKAADGKTICAMPDVCFTPPENPATPPGVPIPYPNTGMASDTTDGSKSVKIGDKEVGLKDKSCFKKSMGDEAGCAAKKGVITSKNTGKVYFKSWSMDVKIEGENAVRHLDMTTNNHGTEPGDTPPWIYKDRLALAKMSGCEDELQALEDGECHKKGKRRCPKNAKLANARKLHKRAIARRTAAKEAGMSLDRHTKTMDRHQQVINKEHMKYERSLRRNPCNKAAACMLVTYEDGNPPDPACCEPQSPHHLVFDSAVKGKGTYKHKNGPCICAAGNASNGMHGLLHAKQKAWMIDSPPKGSTDIGAKKTTVGKWESAAAKTVEEIHPDCSAACIKAQLRKAHKDMGVLAAEPVNMKAAGASADDVPTLEAAWNR